VSEHVLALLRHAKSDWPDGVVDLRRPLGERGRRDAPVAGQVLRERVGTPDLVLVSPAERTRQTWELAQDAFDRPPPREVAVEIYDASVEDLLLLIRAQDESVTTLVLVGHNPGTEELAWALSDGSGDPDASAAMSVKFPTSGLAVLTSQRPWAHTIEESFRLRSFDVPRG
jgi:phosphohistidine phosphatase